MRCCLPMLSLVWACGPPPRPSVLLITVDTTRADHLSPYGAKEARTPTYDQLAAEGTTYLRAYSTAPLTIVSHATIMTGRAPPAHGVRDNGDFLLGQDQVTLAERFHAAGYTTAAFTGAFPTQARWGFGQGFDVYHDPLEGLPTELDWSDQRRADQVVSDAIQTLTDLHTDAPLFVWVHLFDAHWPYAPPEPYRSWFPKAPYDEEIAFASAQVGRFLRWWDEARPDSAMVLTADHGEGLGDGGEKTHGFLLHDATIHVPLFLRGHGALAAAVPAGARVDDVVSHIDIAPTLLDLAGVPLGPELQGRDLRQGGSGVAYSEAMTPQYNLGLAPLYAITDQNGRYTEGAWGAYYPIKGDRIDTNPEVPADLVGGAHRLAALRARLGTTKSTEAALDPKALAQLQALGYLGGDVHAAAGTIDPRDVIDVIPLTWLVK